MSQYEKKKQINTYIISQNKPPRLIPGTKVSNLIHLAHCPFASEMTQTGGQDFSHGDDAPLL